MKQRNTLTDAEHIKLVGVGDEFWAQLGRLAAKCINEMPPELEALTTTYLQDKCSIYGTRYSEYLKELR